MASAVVYGNIGNEAPARGEAIFEADIEDVLVVLDGVGPSDLVIADEVFVGVEDAVADGDGEVVDGEAPWSASGVECDELTHHALVCVGSNASLSVSAATGKGRSCEGNQREELGSIFLWATSSYWSRK